MLSKKESLKFIFKFSSTGENSNWLPLYGLFIPIKLQGKQITINSTNTISIQLLSVNFINVLLKRKVNYWPVLRKLMSMLTTLDFKTVPNHSSAKWQELIQIPWYLRIWGKVWKIWLNFRISFTSFFFFLSFKASQFFFFKYMLNSWIKIRFYTCILILIALNPLGIVLFIHINEK